MGKRNYPELVNRIQKRLDVMRISEAEACRRARVGKETIRAIRRGHAPKAENLTALARALEVPPSHFFDALEIQEPEQESGPALTPAQRRAAEIASKLPQKQLEAWILIGDSMQPPPATTDDREPVRPPMGEARKRGSG